MDFPVLEQSDEEEKQKARLRASFQRIVSFMRVEGVPRCNGKYLLSLL